MLEAPEPNLKAAFEIGFKAPAGIVNQKPIHESIAIAALIQSNLRFPPNTEYKNLSQEQWEIIRGLLWNDDPSCLLFDDYKDDNHDFGYGLQYWREYHYGAANCMTRRSHFGDLEFIHAMAPKIGESPVTTKKNLMTWLEVFYKLSCGNQGISFGSRLDSVLGAYFNDSSAPKGSATLKELILATTPSYKAVNLQQRALGVCSHIVQDSYAVGHTQRRILNPQDIEGRDKQGYLRFKAGTTSKFGNILVFHCFDGQDEPRHTHYDRPKGPAPMPKDLNAFNDILGARDAIEASRKLINFFSSQTKWDDGVSKFLSDEVFALDPDARPSNTEVDKTLPASSSCEHSLYVIKEIEPQDVKEKGNLMELGLTSLEDSASSNWMKRKKCENRVKMILAIILTVCSFVFATLLSVFVLHFVRSLRK